MTNYLDILPYDIKEYIDELVLKLYLEEHKIKFIPVLKEFDCMWLFVLWGSSMFYNYQPINIKNYEIGSNKVVNYLKEIGRLKYIKPSIMRYIHKHSFFVLE